MFLQIIEKKASYLDLGSKVLDSIA